jgi:hypothetical protein
MLRSNDLCLAVDDMLFIICCYFEGEGQFEKPFHPEGVFLELVLVVVKLVVLRHEYVDVVVARVVSEDEAVAHFWWDLFIPNQILKNRCAVQNFQLGHVDCMGALPSLLSVEIWVDQGQQHSPIQKYFNPTSKGINVAKIDMVGEWKRGGLRGGIEVGISRVWVRYIIFLKFRIRSLDRK